MDVLSQFTIKVISKERFEHVFYCIQSDSRRPRPIPSKAPGTRLSVGFHGFAFFWTVGSVAGGLKSVQSVKSAAWLFGV
jgi:hypothetical protein